MKSQTLLDEMMMHIILDKRVTSIYKQSGIKITTAKIQSLANKINFNTPVARIPWIGKLVEIDNKLCMSGFELVFDQIGFGFEYLYKYRDLYKPISHIYTDLCLTLYPAFFTDNIKENAYAHLKEAVCLYIERNDERISRKSPLGNMINNSVLVNSRNYEMISSIYNLMSYEPKYELFGKSLYAETYPGPSQWPGDMLAESLLIYFICRVVVHRLLTECGLIPDILAEVENKIFLNKMWLFPDEIDTKSS